MGTSYGGICTFSYSFPYPIEKVGNFSYLYPVNARIPIKTETNSNNINRDEFICHI